MDISRRRFLETTAAAAIAAPMAGEAHAAQKRPLNLLWIMTDQHPLSLVGAYGKAALKTPNLDRIAAEGVRFDRFHIAAFPCSPSRACLLTGRYAHRHGVITNDVPLSDSVPALGDILKAAGYTAGYIGKWHLSGSMYRNLPGQKPFDGDWYYERVQDDTAFRYTKVQGGTGEDRPQHGFDHWVGGWEQYRAYLRDAGLGAFVAGARVGNHNDAPSGPEGTHIHSKLPQEHHMAAFFAGEAEKFLAAQEPADSPFALVLSFYGPPPARGAPKTMGREVFPGRGPLARKSRGRPQRQTRPATDEQPLLQGLRLERGAVSRHYIRRYWGYCSYIDHQIGRVLEALEATGKAQDTLVLFTSDHGDMVGAHGFVFKLTHCGYDELLRVPLLLRCPGRFQPGTHSNARISSVDVLPTLLEVMGVPAPEGIDGKSFLPVIEGARQEHRPAVFCDSMNRNATVVTDDWKYVLNWNPRDVDELYDLSADPGEMNNLAGQPSQAPVVETMRSLIMQWLTETGHPYRTTIAEAMRRQPNPALDLYPEIADFKYLGGDAFEYTYVWHAVDALPKTMKYWSFTHFLNPKFGKDGEIAFRDTTWPDPPTTEWAAGKDYMLGPIRVQVPGHAGAGDYAVHIGLYNPEHKTSPGAVLGERATASPSGP